MTAEEKTPECQLGMCRLCAGPKEIRVAGYSVPVFVIRCACSCHGRRGSGPVPQA